MDVYEVWGIAAGRGTTKEAAPGAFTVREYRTEVPKNDWREIISITKSKTEVTE